jgi:membrane protease YdiL (CAAX protease family)
MSTPMPQSQWPPLGAEQPRPAADIGQNGLRPKGPARRPDDDGRFPRVDWPWWTAFVALLGGFALAVLGGLVLVGIPAALLGVHYVGSHAPGGVEIAATAVQDAAFVAAALLTAQLGGRVVYAWQFGLRPPRIGARRVVAAMVATYVGFFVFSVAWAAALHITEKEKLLERLGTNEGTALLALSAALTCVIAPICEEFLFRGYIFRALSNLRGPWPAAIATGLLFGGVHAGSAPAADLVPLAVLGFGLCWLYRVTGSLYPCIAVHAVNNCLAFGSLESWGWQIPVLLAGAFGLLALVWVTLRRLGLIGDEPAPAPAVAAAT